MGCGASSEFDPPPNTSGKDLHPYQNGGTIPVVRPDEAADRNGASRADTYGAARADTKSGNPNSIVLGGRAKNGPGTSVAAPSTADPSKLLGKDKYVKDYGALAMEDRSKSGEVTGQLFLFCEPMTEDVVMSYYDIATEGVYARSFTDEQLAKAKSEAGVRFSWAPFFKSLATALIKGKARVSTPSPGQKAVEFIIVNSKDMAHSYPFSVSLDCVSTSDKPNAEATFHYVMEPFTRSFQYNRRTDDNERGLLTKSVECDTMVCMASIKKSNETTERLLPMIHNLREESAVRSHVAMTASRDVRNLEREIKAHREHQIKKHPLDFMYDEGGAQHFRHVERSVDHHPHEEEPDDVLTECIRTAFPLPPGADLSSIVQVLERPNIKRQIDDSGNRQIIVEAFEIFKGIDQWDYDTIQLEIITNGNALFYTTYLLLYKLDLVSYFKLDDEVLRNFLVAVQSSYHPNPYHNAMHGADVTQINYYIMMVAGLQEKCKLSKEEIFAGILAGAIHDFDHPGLNNNFHSRVNAYLAILYNDRSILENHHLACTFELLRNPRYNVLATLTDEQRTLVRDTMLEMVLATDMGNHARIFKSFQVRMSETSDWFSKKEDVRLALSMSIKMADISNCARPNHIYAEWAKNISKEFYLQGDAERELKLSISPFMDRTKEKEEFPKGQISFMMYIVQPMVEAISELLPSLSFAVGLCNENKEYWKRKTEEMAE